MCWINVSPLSVSVFVSVRRDRLKSSVIYAPSLASRLSRLVIWRWRFLLSDKWSRKLGQMSPIRGQTVCVFKDTSLIETGVCLVLILNQSVLKRAEGSLMKLRVQHLPPQGFDILSAFYFWGLSLCLSVLDSLFCPRPLDQSVAADLSSVQMCDCCVSFN